MLTCCPSCATHFRITPAQLKARAGRVRCGQCNFVFNAFETLADEPVKVPEKTSSSPASLGQSAKTAACEIETEVETDSDVAKLALEHTAAVSSQVENYLGDDPLLLQPEATTRRWPWLIGNIIAMLGLLAQATYYYRVELAVLRPDLRPVLQALCEPMHCKVPRPRSIDTLSIEASDLRPDPPYPGHLTLIATLRSKAVYAQEWPLLELTLTDVADHKLAVKHFAASDYLPKDSDIAKRIAAGFPANGETAVTLPLDVGSLPASGYRLYIFYP